MTGQVYFLKAPAVNLIKIGFSIDPERRLNEVRLISPTPVEFMGSIRGDYEEERALHQKFAHLHSHGEWFVAASDLEFEILKMVWSESSPRARELFMDFID
jgi:hypothetical protein